MERTGQKLYLPAYAHVLNRVVAGNVRKPSFGYTPF